MPQIMCSLLLRLKQMAAWNAIPLPQLPEEDPMVAPEELISNLPSSIATLYRQTSVWHSIRTRFYTKGKFLNRFNFRITAEFIPLMLNDMARIVFYQMRNCFYLNLGFGYIVRSMDTGVVRYIYASYNNELLDTPRFIRNTKDLEAVMRDIQRKDIAHWAKEQLLCSNEIVLQFTNVMFFADKLPGAPIE